MFSKWVPYKLHCMVCKIPIGATVRRRHEPEAEHLCFTCPDPGTPEPKAKPAPYGSTVPNIRMNGDIAQSMCDDGVTEMILGWEDR